MSGSVGGGVKAEPNLTPILDMVFQLITFFMMVINFKAAEIDRNLKLPVIGTAAPKPVDKGQRVLVVNVTEETRDKNNRVTHLPKESCPALKVMAKLITRDDIETYLQEEMQTALMKAKLTEDDIKGGDKELKDLVVIRASENCSFGSIQFVINAAQKSGFRQFAFKGFSDETQQARGWSPPEK